GQREGIDEIVFILPGDCLHELLGIGLVGDGYEIDIHGALARPCADERRTGRPTFRPRPCAAKLSHKHWIECAYVPNETLRPRFFKHETICRAPCCSRQEITLLRRTVSDRTP